MAGKNDEDERIRRRREREDEEEQEKRANAGTSTAHAAMRGDSGALDALISEVNGQVDRVHSLYLQFFSGVERLPPNEARKRLEELIERLEKAPKPAPAYRFRATTVTAKFRSFKERWEKTLADLEAGRIRRPSGPAKR